MTTQNFAFLNYGATQTVNLGLTSSVTVVAVTATFTFSQVVAVTAPVTINPISTAVRLYNAGTYMPFVNFGATAANVASGFPVPTGVAPFVLRSGGSQILQVQIIPTTSTVTAASLTITAGVGTIYATFGEGVD